MSDIDWNQKRKVLRNSDGEFFVRVETGVMNVEDYIEGGPVQLEKLVGPLEFVGVFTNAEIDNGKHEDA